MARPTKQLRDQRYLGDSARRVVHDLWHEDPTPQGCRTFDLAQAGQAVRFEPDSLKQAVDEGYQPCEKCFFGLERRRTFITRALVDRGG